MDALSVSGSVVALLTVAAGSCGYLFAFFRSLSDTPADIRSLSNSIRCLQTTLLGLRTLYADLPVDYQMRSGLAAKITEFLGKTREVEQMISSSSAMLSRGTMRRSWTRVKWTLTSDRWLGKFFKDLEFWNLLFSHEVSAVQM